MTACSAAVVLVIAIAAAATVEVLAITTAEPLDPFRRRGRLGMHPFAPVRTS
jgi:hypothetical protein